MPNRGLPENIQPLDSGHISHHDTVHDLLNPVFDDWLVAGTQAGEEVDRPTDLDAENAGFLWWNNDVLRMDRWSGTAWQEGIGGSGSSVFVYGGGHNGDLVVDTGTLRDDIFSDQTLIKGVWSVDETDGSPAGQAAIFDAIYHPPGGGAASIFDVGNKPTINPGETRVEVIPDTTQVEAGGWFTYDTTQIGGAITAGLVPGTVATYGDGLTNAPTSFPMPMPANGSYDIGDLLVCVVVMGNTTNAFPLTVPAGWTSKALAELTTTGHFVAVLWKEATTSSEAGGTITPAGGVNRPYCAATFAVRGVLVTDAVFDVPRTSNTGANTYTTPSTSTPATVDVSTTEDNDVGFFVYTVRYLSTDTPGNATADTPNPGTEIVDIKTARVSQVNCSLHIYNDDDLGVAGALGAPEVLLAAGTGWSRGIMFPIALKVSGAAGGPGADLSYKIYARE
jgi:hypothetical protein